MKGGLRGRTGRGGVSAPEGLPLLRPPGSICFYREIGLNSVFDQPIRDLVSPLHDVFDKSAICVCDIARRTRRCVSAL